MKQYSLEAKVILVTGASAGIGKAIAQELVQQGAKVVGLARRKEKLNELEKEFSNERGSFYGIDADVTNEKEIKDAFEQIKSKYGKLDALINNAGITRASRLKDGLTEDWKQVIDTNLLGVCIASREAIELMKETNNNKGYIININSVAGHRIPSALGHLINIYSATKHAVTAMSQTLRHELMTEKSNIRITSLSPGYVATDIVNSANLEELDVDLATVAALRPVDIAETCVFLLTRPHHVEIEELIIKPHGELF